MKTIPKPEPGGLDVQSIIDAFAFRMKYSVARDAYNATDLDAFQALAFSVRDRVMDRWFTTQDAFYKLDTKRVYYLSAEFLMGRALLSNLLNLGLYETAADPGEMITEIWFPRPARQAALTEFAQRQGDFAIVAAAVSAQVTDGTCDAVRVVLGGVGTRPLLLDTGELAGAPAGAATWQAAGELAAAAIDPPSDGHASGDYRKRLAATLVTRALTEAATTGATGA